MLPAQAPNTQERGRPARRTNLAPRLREVLDIVLLMLLVRRRVRGRLSRHALHVAHDTSASKGLPCPEVQHLPPDHRLFLRRVTRASLRHSSCWLSCAFPRQPKGPEKATFFSTQKGPSQAVCRLFTLAPLTVIRPRTGAESAKKKKVNPNVSTLTRSNKFTLIPLQTFQRLRWSSNWTFQVFFRHAQAGSGGFFPECFFDELGDKFCLLHLLPLSWPTKDSPFDSMCRLFFFRPHCLVQFFMVVVHRFPLLSLDSVVNGLAEGMPIRIDQREPHRSSPVGSTDESAPYTFFMRPQV